MSTQWPDLAKDRQAVEQARAELGRDAAPGEIVRRAQELKAVRSDSLLRACKAVELFTKIRQERPDLWKQIKAFARGPLA